MINSIENFGQAKVIGKNRAKRKVANLLNYQEKNKIVNNINRNIKLGSKVINAKSDYDKLAAYIESKLEQYQRCLSCLRAGTYKIEVAQKSEQDPGPERI